MHLLLDYLTAVALLMENRPLKVLILPGLIALSHINKCAACTSCRLQPGNEARFCPISFHRIRGCVLGRAEGKEVSETEGQCCTGENLLCTMT